MSEDSSLFVSIKRSGEKDFRVIFIDCNKVREIGNSGLFDCTVELFLEYCELGFSPSADLFSSDV